MACDLLRQLKTGGVKGITEFIRFNACCTFGLKPAQELWREGGIVRVDLPQAAHVFEHLGIFPGIESDAAGLALGVHLDRRR